MCQIYPFYHYHLRQVFIPCLDLLQKWELVFLSVHTLSYLSCPLTAKLILLRHMTFIMLLTPLLNICKDCLMTKSFKGD